jgi:hypothetical protein
MSRRLKIAAAAAYTATVSLGLVVSVGCRP